MLNNTNAVENGKVTSTNFFNNDTHSQVNMEEDLTSLNESMITCKVDPEQWNEEVKRVQKQLTLFEIEQNKLALSSEEDSVNNIKNVVKYASEAYKIASEKSGLPDLLNKVIDMINSELYFVSKEETKMNTKNENDIKRLKEIAVHKDDYLKELYNLRDRMKNKIQQFEEITQKWEELHEKIEAKRATIEGTEKLNKIKTSLNSLKAEWLKLDITIGVFKVYNS